MARKYSKSAGDDVERAVHDEKRGKLKSGKGGKGGTVKSRKQAIAIGLSEARAKGKKVPKEKSQEEDREEEKEEQLADGGEGKKHEIGASDHPDPSGTGIVPDVALQHRLELLPERRSRTRSSDRDHIGVDGTNIGFGDSPHPSTSSG